MKTKTLMLDRSNKKREIEFEINFLLSMSRKEMKTTEQLTEELLKLFNEHNVKYVVIGAVALPVYGFIRATTDTDILIEPTQENAKRAMKALKDFGYSVVEDITLKDFLEKKHFCVFPVS